MPSKTSKREVPLKMKPNVGSTVTRRDRPPSQHGVVTDVSKDSVTVHWHLKQNDSLGPAGLAVGKLYEDPASLVSDTPCPFCKVP